MSNTQQFWDAIESGDASILRDAIDAGADVDATDDFGFPPLVSAAHHARLGVVLALLEAGANPNARVREQDTALHRALRFGSGTRRDGRPLNDAERESYLPIIQALLGAGADHTLESEGRSALALAVEQASIGAVEALLVAGASATESGLLSRAIRSRRDRDAKVSLLLREGADADEGCPLPDAANTLFDDRAVATCEELLDAGASVDQVTEGGWSALTHAIAAENLPLVQLLLSKGARADLPIRYDEHQAGLSPGMTAAHIAAHFELTDFVDAIAAAGQAPSSDPLESAGLVGRWRLVAVSTDHEGEMYALAEEDWIDLLGASDGFLELHADGRFEGREMSEIGGTWAIVDDALRFDGEELEPSMWVSMELGNRQLVIGYDDDFGRREFRFERE